MEGTPSLDATAQVEHVAFAYVKRWQVMVRNPFQISNLSSRLSMERSNFGGLFGRHALNNNDSAEIMGRSAVCGRALACLGKGTIGTYYDVRI